MSVADTQVVLDRGHRLQGGDGDVDADQVEQRERAHRVTGAGAHQVVDLINRHALLVQSHGVVEERDEQPVDDGAAGVGAGDGRLAEVAGPRAGGRPQLVGAGHVVRHHHLDQLHDLRRVEEMQRENRPPGADRRA